MYRFERAFPLHFEPLEGKPNSGFNNDLRQVGATGFEPATSWSRRTSRNRCFLRKNHVFRDFIASIRACNTFRPFSFLLLFLRYFRRYQRTKTVQRRYISWTVPLACFQGKLTARHLQHSQARSTATSILWRRLETQARTTPDAQYALSAANARTISRRIETPQQPTGRIRHGRTTGRPYRQADRSTGHAGSPRHRLHVHRHQPASVTTSPES